MAAPTTTYRMWKRLAERPGGSRLFSAAAIAPLAGLALSAKLVARRPNEADLLELIDAP